MLSSGAANASEQQEAASEIRRLQKKLRVIRAVARSLPGGLDKKAQFTEMHPVNFVAHIKGLFWRLASNEDQRKERSARQ
jgi:hypothetical protein